ncbi:MAG: tetratricopeptide (TPR) repeat protein [Gammaproteobacteria bacterium]|jgi:tetratricopeptide (TPR) repeat protein
MSVFSESTKIGMPSERNNNRIRTNFLFVVLAMAILVGCSGSERREAAHFDRGLAFFQNHNYSKAQLEFRNVLKINPRSVKGYYYLALVEEAQGNLTPAFTNFVRASELNPNHLPSLTKIGQHFLYGNRLDKAQEQANIILNLEQGSADGHALQGAIYLRRGELLLARQEIELALLADPTHLAAMSATVGIERKTGSLGKALTALAKSIEAHPEEIGLRLLEAELLVENNALSEAEQVYLDLIGKDPDNLSLKTNLVKLLIRQKRKNDAEDYLQGLVAATPHGPEPALLLVDFLFNQRSFIEAEAALLGYTEKYPTELTYRFALAGYYLKQDEQPKAVQVYRDIIEQDKSYSKTLIARLALVQTHISQGEKQLARAQIAEILQENPNNVEALFLRAYDQLYEGHYSGAIADLGTLLRLRPEFNDGRILLAEAHLRNFEPAKAIATLSALLEHSPENHGIRVALARQLSRQGENDTALALLKETLAHVPDDLAALKAQVEIFFMKENWPALVEAATVLIQRTPENAESYYIRGQAHLAQLQYSKAEADFVAVLDLAPDSLSALVGLVHSYLGRGEGEKAEELLLARLATASDKGPLRNILGEFYRTTGNRDKAIKTFRLTIESSDEYAPAYANLANMSFQAGNVAEAIKIYNDGLAEFPGHEQLSFGLATTLSTEQEYAAAIKIYEAMLLRNRDLPFVANNLAALIADFQYNDGVQLARALDLAKSFSASANPLFLDTLGWVHFRAGNVDKALRYLEKSASSAPNVPQLQYHLGTVYHAVGETQKAELALERALTEGADYPGLQVARDTWESLKTSRSGAGTARPR